MICKVCNKEINTFNLMDPFDFNKKTICHNCFLALKPRVVKTKLRGYNLLTLYDYNEKMKELIYRYKACYDVELKDVFLQYFLSDLQIRFCTYAVAFAPSNKSDNEDRGFNHVELIAEKLGIKRINCFYKKEAYKQSDSAFSSRKKIKNIIGINEKDLKGVKKLLIVDDIITSGETITTCAELAKSCKVRKIALLVVARSRKKSK